MAEEKNKLVSQAPAQVDPYKVKGSDFPHLGPAAGSSEGHNELAEQSYNQCSPRHAEDSGAGDSGAGTPAPTDRAAVVAKNFKVGQSSAEEGTSVGGGVGVDLKTGKIAGKSSTPVDEVPDPKLSIG